MRNSSAESRSGPHPRRLVRHFLAAHQRLHGIARTCRKRDSRRETRMIMGALGNGPSRKLGRRFGETANFSLSDRELAWFDHYLKARHGIDREPPVRIFYMGANVWKTKQTGRFPGTNSLLYWGRISHASGVRSAGEHKLNFVLPADRHRQLCVRSSIARANARGQHCCGTPTPLDQGQRPLEERPMSGLHQRSPHSSSAIAGP